MRDNGMELRVRANGLVFEAGDGTMVKGFEQLKAYTANKGRVSAIIQIPALKEETYGRDFAEMLQDRRTFDEALADSALTIMTRQRLKIVKTQLFAQLENAAVL